MENYLQFDAWNMIEEDFHPEYQELTESIFSIGNGKIGHRACFEEQYSGTSFRGGYVAGVYYHEKMAFSSWRNGHNEYFAKMPNAPDWSGIEILVNGEVLDLATCRLKNFRRVLNMKEGTLDRYFEAKLLSGKEIRVRTTRFCSIAEPDVAVIRYAIQPVNFTGNITATPYLDGNTPNKGASPDEIHWIELEKSLKKRSGFIVTMTPKTHFHVCTGMRFTVEKNETLQEAEPALHEEDKYVACSVKTGCKPKDEIVICKYVGVVTSLDVEKSRLMDHCKMLLKRVQKKGFDELYQEHKAAWASRWESSDVVIDGDLATQQGIRFQIFHLLQSCYGLDERLNVQPAGFTGKDFEGCATWENEVFYLPFFLSAMGQSVARNLLLYRYRQLPLAIEKAVQLGMGNGAALFPYATLNGEECRDEWETAMETVHRNGAIAYAICHYFRSTGDIEFLVNFGLEILLGIARFWSQRAQWSATRQQYVILGVTGPNEYENNVNNNWYTNYMASWCLQFAMEAMATAEAANPEGSHDIMGRLEFDYPSETARWQDIIEKMYYPKDETQGIFLQQADFLDKEMRSRDLLTPEEVPLRQHWSWDRILRSCYIQQPDVLLGLYMFEDRFSKEEIRQHFDFYEPLTVYETGHATAIPAILAAKLGRVEQAFELLQQTIRTGLDIQTGQQAEGLDLQRMAGTWLTLVHGFAGMRIEEDSLSFSPVLPEPWQGYAINLVWRGFRYRLTVNSQQISLQNFSDRTLPMRIFGQLYEAAANGAVRISL
jgi:maltose phosphorylase